MASCVLKTLFLAGVIGCSLAQTAYTQHAAYAQHHVGIELSETMGLALRNASGAMVNFEFNNVTAYSAGVSVFMRDHLAVTCNRRFNLVARAASENFAGGSIDLIPASVLRIDVTNTEIADRRYIKQPIEQLTTVDRPLLSQVPPLINALLNVRYTIPASQANKYILGKQPGLYTNAVIYTLTMQ